MPINGYKSRYTNAEILAAIDALTGAQKEVLLLAVVEGFTCKEFTCMLNVRMGTVMPRLSRGRVVVRELLSPQERTNLPIDQAAG